MDFIKKMTSGQGKQSTTDQPPTQGGFMTSVSDSMGGGQTGERNEGTTSQRLNLRAMHADLDVVRSSRQRSAFVPVSFLYWFTLADVTSSRFAAVDYAQERMGGGPQTNESSMEQAKDERISDAIRSGYKNATGKDVPIADK